MSNRSDIFVTMKLVLVPLSIFYLFAGAVIGQTTEFTYQGSLRDGGNPANGSFQMQFKLFDALSSGNQIGSTMADVPVTATQGVFSTKLDFGSNALSGANRWLEIAVRRNSGESYVTLSPREQISSAPYSVRTLSAAQADTALDSQKLGGIAADQYATTASVATSFIRNDTAVQTANFSIGGNGRVGGNFGIGTTTPGSGFEMRGTGLAAQQRITDSASGNSLVLQGGPGNNMKVTGFNYGTGIAQPLYLSTDGANTLINSNGGNVGIRTASPTNSLDVNGTIRAFSSSDSRLTVETSGTNNLARLLLSSANRSWFLGTTQSFNNDEFYIGEGLGGNKVTIATDGTVGFGKRPDPFFQIDANGPIRAQSPSAGHVIAQTTGGTNTWARFYMRSPNRSWFIGTSQNFNGDQFYLVDETAGQTRFSIQPAGGPISYLGNTIQDAGSYGLPKAMLLVLANGVISRCYNGVTGSTVGGCGFSATRRIISGIGPTYDVNLGFSVSNRFASLTVNGGNSFFGTVTLSGNIANASFSNGDPNFTQDSDFFLIVY